MPTDKVKALKEVKRVLGYIEKPALGAEDKDAIVKDSVENFNEHVNPGWLIYRKSVSTDATFVEWEDGAETFKDVYGKEFIDVLGGYGIYMCGHRNPEILKYVKAQLDRYALHSQELVDPLRGYLAKILAMITPGDLQYAFFTNGGAEAVEMALKLARLATGKQWYISMTGGFHGKSMGAVSVNGKGTYREPYKPLIPGVMHVEYGDAVALEKAISNLIKTGETVAGVIMEPIQGEAGIILPPEGYLKKVRAICDKYEVVLIFDEIQTGMGRTGTMWACEADDVVPDILVYGKAFGGGIMPITGIIARPHLWTDQIKENPWILGSPTFGGNPLACSAALATIKYMLETDLPGQVAEKGKHMMTRLMKMKEEHPILMDIRGKGFLIGLDYPTPEMGWAVSKGLFKRGVLTGGTLNNAKTNRIEPPGIMSYETMDKMLDLLDETLFEVEKEFSVTWENRDVLNA